MARKRRLSRLTEEYQLVRSTYVKFAVKIEELIRALLKEKGISYHSITSRAKDVKSFAEKISREEKAYKEVSDITDLAGIRIICYLSDEVDVIAEVLRDEFTIIEEQSIDKRKTMDPDRFGYLSLHYVAKLPDGRVDLTEYQSYRDLLCEIQIRTILQHAWAEIEHDLGYKSPTGIPQRVKREFYRLAGLLELADAEFYRIKKEVEDYADEVPDQIKESPESVAIDNVSLRSYLIGSEDVRGIEERISELLEAEAREVSLDYVADLVEICSYFGFKTIDDLDVSIRANKSRIVDFAEEWMKYPDPEPIPELGTATSPVGISVYYLGLVLASKTRNRVEIAAYLKMALTGWTSEDRSEMVDNALRIARALWSSTR